MAGRRAWGLRPRGPSQYVDSAGRPHTLPVCSWFWKLLNKKTWERAHDHREVRKHLAPHAPRLPSHPPALSVSPPQGRRFVYAGSSSGVVQAPVAFCEKHATCEDCVLARDPYCAWSSDTKACVALHQTDSPSRYAGDAACRPSQPACGEGTCARMTVLPCLAGI